MLYDTIPVDNSSRSALNGSFLVTIISVIQCECAFAAWYCEYGPGQPSIETIVGCCCPSISPAYVQTTPRPEITAAAVPSLYSTIQTLACVASLKDPGFRSNVFATESSSWPAHGVRSTHFHVSGPRMD